MQIFPSGAKRVNRISALMWGAGALLVALGVLALLTYRNFQGLSEATQWHIHTYRVLSEVARARSALDSIERQLRGYSLSNDREFMRKIADSRGDVKASCRELQTLTTDQIVQQQRIARWKSEFEKWDATYAARYERTRASAEIIGRELRPRRVILLQLLSQLDQIERAEQTFLKERVVRQEQAQNAAFFTIIGGSALAMSLGAGLLILLGRTARAHESAAHQLERSYAMLSEEVGERRVAQEKARSNELIYRHLAEDSLDLICRHLPDGTFTYVSPASKPLLGYGSFEMLGLTPMHFLTREEKKRVLARWRKNPLPRFAQILEGTNKRPLLRLYQHADGSEVWLETIGHAIRDSETGQVLEWHTTSRDVSARMRADESRQRMAGGLRSIVEATDELLLCPDEQTLCRRAVELAREKLGLTSCRLLLASRDGHTMRGTFGIDAQGRTVDETSIQRKTQGFWRDEPQNPPIGQRFVLHRSPENPHVWNSVAIVSAPSGELGVFCHDNTVSGLEHDLVTQQIVMVYCSLLGTLIERERNLARWRESQKMLETIVENAPLMLYAVDKNGIFTVSTGKALRALGFEPHTSVGKHYAEVVGADSPSAQAIARVLKGESLHATLRYGARYLEMWREPVRGVNGQVEGALGVGFDVTERILAENELRESLEMQRAILEGASYSIVATDADGWIRVFNRAAEKMSGYSAAEMIGKHVDEFLEVAYESAELEARAAQLSQEFGVPIAPDSHVLVARAQRGGLDEQEWTNTRKDGTKYPVRLSIQAMRGSSGEIIGYVSIGYDLSESRRAERLKNEFVSVVSHELRTPLTSIRGSLGLMQGGVVGPMPDAARQMIDIAAKNAERLVLLINDILDIEKIESGKMRFDFGEISLESLLASAIEANKNYGETFDVSIERSASPLDLRQAFVWGDESRLMQVLANFLSNACKFSPAGSRVLVGATLLDEARIRIWVRDAGEGVPAEFEGRLFERFMQADSSATRKKGGTGLGLAISKAIIEKHGGQIGYIAPIVEKSQGDSSENSENSASPSFSEEGSPDFRVEKPAETIFVNGATFYFDLDLMTMKTVSQNETPRILVCEDDEDVAVLLRSILESSGYAVKTSPTLERAREMLSGSEEFTAMTLDLEMPDGNGIELLRELRESSDEKLRSLPILIVSAYAQAGKLSSGGALDVLDWIPKPFDARHLLSTIKRAQGAAKPAGKANVLHVEDDADVRRVTEVILADAAKITPAATLHEAKNALQNQNFDLALIDVGLPDGNGLDLISLLSQREPPVPIVLFSAREDEISHLQNVAAALTKSRTTNAKLRETIGKLLARR